MISPDSHCNVATGDRRYGLGEVGVRFARSLPGGVADSCVILCHAFV